MLNLQLRSEFQGIRLTGTTIDFTNRTKTGALEKPASDFLKITYPTQDLLKTIESVGPGKSRPLVLIGNRGQGKSHLLAALYHVLTDSFAAQSWLDSWASKLNDDSIRQIKVRSDCCVIAESLHLQRYKYLWDILFDRHPEGNYYRGAWENLGEKKTDIPNVDILDRMFDAKPTVLILDEFQTWYEGLTNSKQYPWRNWAFNFIQILSEIAQKNPDKLVLAVSVRDGDSDAYQQVRRVNPVDVDFKGYQAKHDRKRLLLYRIFENRSNIPDAQISIITEPHILEYLRLAEVPQSEHEKVREDFQESWPYAPHLLNLLEDQVLIATDAQETRDLIRILVDLFKSRGEKSPIITAADFELDSDRSGVAALLDSVSNQLHRSLREKAIRNLESVHDAVKNAKQEVPHASELISALWLRSLSVDRHVGAEPSELQIDLTRDKPLDDNAFQAELATIVDNSFNIHQLGSRYVFKDQENADAKLKSQARNDKYFANDEDVAYLASEIRYVIGGGNTTAQAYRVIAMKKDWEHDPWSNLEEGEHPDLWDARIPILILPEYPEKHNKVLGKWLITHINKKRNVVRFLLPLKDSGNTYFDRDLTFLARCVYLAGKWKSEDPEYAKLHSNYQRELRDTIKARFDRFAILSRWNFADPAQCEFVISSLSERGDKIPAETQSLIKQNLFVPEDFEELVMDLASTGDSVATLITELQEPRSDGRLCIPWLGEIEAKEQLLKLCADGKIALDLRGTEMLQPQPGEDFEATWQRIRGKLGTGRDLEQTKILKPGATTSSGSVTATPTIQDTGNADAIVQQPTPDHITTTDAIADVSNIFGGGSTGDMTTTAPIKEPHTCDATSGLNLLGKLEAWSINPATDITNISIKVTKMTGAQLRNLIENLPDGMTYELSLEKESS